MTATDPRQRALDTFREAFRAEPQFVARAPGRVNLLGEHVDYNDGWVLPVAIDRAAYVAGAAQPSRQAWLAAADLNAQARFSLDDLDARQGTDGQPMPPWALYPAGVAWSLQADGLAVNGLRAALAANVPRGAGLSSSAAVEVAFAMAWSQAGGWRLDPMAMAQACQRAENQYVGVSSGLMDQFASACGRAGHALLLDCRTLAWQAVPLPPGVSIVVANSGVRRELSHSEYNLRRQQCQAAVDGLRPVLPGIRALRDVTPEQFERHAARLDPLLARRARHVVEECARTLAGAQLLKDGRLADFGALMNDCHASLRDLYEVSIPELNALADAAHQMDGCYGARLTGAGFGGCTVNLVASDAAPDFQRDLARAYRTATNRNAEIYICHPAPGASIEPS